MPKRLIKFTAVLIAFPLAIYPLALIIALIDPERVVFSEFLKSKKSK